METSEVLSKVLAVETSEELSKVAVETSEELSVTGTSE